MLAYYSKFAGMGNTITGYHRTAAGCKKRSVDYIKECSRAPTWRVTSWNGHSDEFALAIQRLRDGNEVILRIFSKELRDDEFFLAE